MTSHNWITKFKSICQCRRDRSTECTPNVVMTETNWISSTYKPARRTTIFAKPDSKKKIGINFRFKHQNIDASEILTRTAQHTRITLPSNSTFTFYDKRKHSKFYSVHTAQQYNLSNPKIKIQKHKNHTRNFVWSRLFIRFSLFGYIFSAWKNENYFWKKKKINGRQNCEARVSQRTRMLSHQNRN